ncbi:16031_t:CDS:2, partial [Funneliformis geosporum]
MEEEKRTDLSGEWIDRTTEEKGFRAMFQEFIAKAPPEYVNKDLKLSDDFPKKENKGNKRCKKPSIKKICSLLIKASYLMDRKIKLEDRLYVKVIAVKMSKDRIFLE